MSEIINKKSAIIVIDPKKNRIRIYKSILYSIGNPKYIQLLVSPTKKIVAIRAIDTVFPGDQIHKVEYSKFSDKNCEIYSRNFIITLCSVLDEIDYSYSYRISGTVSTRRKAAIFQLKTLSKIIN